MPTEEDENGGDANNESKGWPVGGIHLDNPREIAHACIEDPMDIMFMDEGDGEPGTGVG